VPLVPERSDFLEGDSPAAEKVEAFLANALAATGSANITAGALVPWICDVLLSNHSVKAYGRDLMDFLRHMQAQGVTPLEVTPDHVKMYKRELLEAGRTSATVARRLSVLRGTYKQLAAKGLISWETAQDIGAVKAPGVQKNSTPSLTKLQAISLLEAIPSDTLQGIRDLALMSVFFITGCRVSAVIGSKVGHLGRLAREPRPAGSPEGDWPSRSRRTKNNAKAARPDSVRPACHHDAMRDGSCRAGPVVANGPSGPVRRRMSLDVALVVPAAADCSGGLAGASGRLAEKVDENGFDRVVHG
jgi:hypothetical protein